MTAGWLAGIGPWLPLGVLLVVLVAGLVAYVRAAAGIRDE